MTSSTPFEMPLLLFPIELILLIADKIESERDMNAFNRTNKLINTLTTNTLYKNNVQKHNSSALFWAAKNGRIDIARRILECGANINIRDNHELTPLLYAVTGKHLDTTRFLLDRGADIHAAAPINDEIDIHQQYITGPALREAVISDCAEMVEFLLSRGADANADFGVCYCMGSSAMTIANKAANRDIVKLLLEHGADMQRRNVYGTPVEQAVGWEDEQLVTELSMLETRTLMPDTVPEGSVEDLCCVPHTRIVELFMQRGADVNAAGGRFRRSIHQAETMGRIDIKDFLIVRREDPILCIRKTNRFWRRMWYDIEESKVK